MACGAAKQPRIRQHHLVSDMGGEIWLAPAKEVDELTRPKETDDEPKPQLIELPARTLLNFNCTPCDRRRTASADDPATLTTATGARSRPPSWPLRPSRRWS